MRKIILRYSVNEQIKNYLTSGEWHVVVDDHNIPWDDDAKAYDPTR